MNARIHLGRIVCTPRFDSIVSVIGIVPVPSMLLILFATSVPDSVVVVIS